MMKSTLTHAGIRALVAGCMLLVAHLCGAQELISPLNAIPRPGMVAAEQRSGGAE